MSRKDGECSLTGESMLVQRDIHPCQYGPDLDGIIYVHLLIIMSGPVAKRPLRGLHGDPVGACLSSPPYTLPRTRRCPVSRSACPSLCRKNTQGAYVERAPYLRRAGRPAIPLDREAAGRGLLHRRRVGPHLE
ncbi:hypothetical protein CDEST_11463 [Colletotrichum destructivum]|uniref:Uncharacterized protein n=1 Tax=Colletotrichum destructivum TaxID=34406 RepID=A0AAX4ITB0_9PEZI|nr:hypothetical protein CDEST_11463 [Colletotrichum destructivum]